MQILDIISKEEHFFPYHDRSRVPLCVLRVASENWGPRFRIARDGLQRYIAIYVIAGRGTLRSDSGEQALGPGNIFVIGAGAAHDLSCDPRDPMQVLIAVFSGQQAAKLMAAAFGRVNSVIRTAAPAGVHALMAPMVSEARQKSICSHDVCMMLLRALLLKIGALRKTETGAPPPSLGTYLRCRRHIDDHYTRLANVREIATECHVDPAYLCRLFARFARETPYVYLTRLKMSHASHLLMTSDFSIKQIAAELSFADPYTFSRAFRRSMRQSPQHFRKAAGKEK